MGLLLCLCRLSILHSLYFFFFKQKTAYELRISDWSSDVCSSYLKTVVRFVDDGGSTGLVGLDLQDTRTGELSFHSTDGGFVAIGHEPATELFAGKLPLDRDGYIEVVPGSTRTSVLGVFACGDVMDKVYRQAITAAGKNGRD